MLPRELHVGVVTAHGTRTEKARLFAWPFRSPFVVLAAFPTTHAGFEQVIDANMENTTLWCETC